MRKIALLTVFAVFMLPSSLFADSEHSECHEPTWENLSIGVLSLMLEREENSLDQFAVDGSKEKSVTGRKGFNCDNLVARFMPEKYPEIESRFELREACEEAKEIARDQVEEFRENPCFVDSHYTDLGDYDFEEKRFPVKEKHPKGRGVEIPDKYRGIGADWPTAYGTGGYNHAEDETWCLEQFWLKFSHPVEDFWMDMDDAEKFAKDHDKVFVRYEFTLEDNEGKPLLSQINKKTRMWVYESEETEDLIAVNFEDRGSNFADPVCDINRTRDTKELSDEKLRTVREKRDPCQEYKIGEYLK